MPEKTKTIVVIESHEQTIIRRSRREISSQMPTQGDVDRPRAVPVAGVTTGCSIGSVSSDATDRFAKRKRRWLGVLWRMVALKGVTVFAAWSRRLKHREIEQRDKQP